MADLPTPSVPPDLDLRGFQFMPLDVARLIDSDLNALATPEEFRAAVRLWCKAWHQIPASSLPGDERLLAHLAGYGDDIKRWRKVSGMALRGFEKCSDGRFYHAVIAEKAIEAGGAKKERSDSNSAERERKKREREDRSRMFALIKEAGVTPDWNTSTRDLRQLVTDLSRVTGDGHPPDIPPLSLGNPETVTPHVTAMTGTGTGTGREREREGARARGHRDIAQDILADKSFAVTSWEDGFLSNIAATPKLSGEQQTAFDAIVVRWEARKATAPPAVKQVAVIEGTPQWEAWERHMGKRLPVTDIRDPDPRKQIRRGWWAPSEWPPGHAAETPTSPLKPYLDPVS